MSIELNVKLDQKSLGTFLLYHNYARPAGIIGLLISAAALAIMFIKWDYWTATQKGILVLLALLFTVIQPLMLISKGKKQLQMEEFQIPFQYIFSPEGIEIKQNEQAEKFQWKQVRKIVYRSDAIYVYMSTVSAFILPKSQCDGKFEDLMVMMKENAKK